MNSAKAPVMVTSSNELQVATNLITSSSSMTGQTLTEFHLFPKLPLELRLMIFKHAVPSNHRRFIYIHMDFKAADEEFGLYFEFNSGEWGHGWAGPLADGMEVSLLANCVESRQVYIEENKNILLGWRKQKWLSEIKHLATGIISFNTHRCDHGPFMVGFQNIESWTGVVPFNEDPLSPDKEEYRQEAQRDLEMYKKETNPSYKILRISVQVRSRFDLPAEHLD
ncbi:hypothetical protein DL95DRAFT_461895 [Leptodontidium sp. 2 PMI_412]|nr:hypothetical protein DL95DRAFT_461895 [Leptodontidium sp. 2 PMI_412]